jgi:hypothetical protein
VGASTEHGRLVTITTRVYTDSGYTTLDTLNGQGSDTYRVKYEQAFGAVGGGGATVDYEKIRKMIQEELGKIPKEDYQGQLTTLTESIVKIKDIETLVSSLLEMKLGSLDKKIGAVDSGFSAKVDEIHNLISGLDYSLKNSISNSSNLEVVNLQKAVAEMKEHVNSMALDYGRTITEIVDKFDKTVEIITQKIMDAVKEFINNLSVSNGIKQAKSLNDLLNFLNDNKQEIVKNKAEMRARVAQFMMGK